MKASKFLLAGAVVALLPFAAANAQTPDPNTSTAADPAQSAPSAQPARQGVTFESLDANSDGKISKTEAAANQNVSDQFSRYDKNGNGFIERDEVGASNHSQPDSQPQQ
ncbi:MAG TPA: hypothetical protein VMF52_18405 [Steroidobacteraceae bacterium]|nr:hypothetical protein [Steroidobacteraceae bacterium]